MAPEVKPVISSLAEMTCENCVYSNISKTPTDGRCCCFFHTAWQKLDIGDFCSKGSWRVVIAAGRSSVVDFQAAYDYLS